MSAERATPTADLQRHAAECGVPLSDRGARKMRARLGDDGAHERVSAAGALLDLASTIPGITLSATRAYRLLDAHAGDYDAARDAVMRRWRIRYDAAWWEAWEELEAQLWALDARARHAAALGDAARGPLGWQAEMLLVAAFDAGLPDAAEYRRRLVQVVHLEIERRYPVHPKANWQVLDEDTGASSHAERVQRAIRDEEDARALVLRRAPELRQQIDKLADEHRLREQIEEVLAELRLALGEAAVAEHWRPDLDRYRREVIEPANQLAERRVA